MWTNSTITPVFMSPVLCAIAPSARVCNYLAVLTMSEEKAAVSLMSHKWHPSSGTRVSMQLTSNVSLYTTTSEQHPASHAVIDTKPSVACYKLLCSLSTNAALKCDLSDRSFAAAGPRAWNKLPPPLRCVSSPAAFKRQLKTFLYNHAFNLHC